MSVASKISPVSATRATASKVTWKQSVVRATQLTEIASWYWDNSDVGHQHFPKQGGNFRGNAAQARSNPWIEAEQNPKRECKPGP
jgi:hypothetical protein